MNPKSKTEIEYMRKGGKLLAKILNILKQNSKIGITENELDKMSQELCKEYAVSPAFFKYKGFPKSLCISVNDKIVHGIATDRKIKEGDLVSLDFGIIYKGLYTDAAVSFLVSSKDPKIEDFIAATKKSRDEGIKASLENNFVGDISFAMQKPILEKGYSIVKELAGHGIGYKLHEDPFILGYGRPKTGMKLRRNMTIAIESMINMGSADILEENDNWTIRTKDGSLSCHFEHTILITDSTPEILTLL